MLNEGNTNSGLSDYFSGYNNANMPEMQTDGYPEAEETPMIDDAMSYRAIFPEIYYKLKPHITMTCDVLSTYGDNMPTQKQLEHISDGIFEDFCAMYPDMANYMNKGESEADDPPGDPPPFRGGFRDGFRGGFRPGFGFGGRFRRRGLGRDFIDALLLSELLGRGYYY